MQIRLDLLGDVTDLRPRFPELGRMVRRDQLFATGPLHIIDDARSIATPVQTDRDEPRLMGHEAGSLGHKRQEFVLLALLRFGSRDLDDEFLVGSDLWHRRVL
jgi:hypothetical protein